MRKKKLTKTHADRIFKQVQLIEDLYYENIRALERTMLAGYDGIYEIAVVGGDIVGIGQITKTGKKLIYHR